MRSLSELEIYLRVVERGSLTAAAEQLGLPVPSVSRKLAALEKRLGVQLLHRTTRRLAVTEAGRAFYERCSAALATIEDAEAAVRSLTLEPAGTLRVLASYGFGVLGIEPRLVEFRRRYPRILLCLFLDNQPLDLLEHGFDVAIRPAPVPDSSYRMRALRRLRMRLVASPAYLDRAGRPSSPAAIGVHALLVVGGEAQKVHWTLKGPGGNAEIAGTPALVANDPTVIRRQAIAGAGIALLSESSTRVDVEAGALEPVLPDWSRLEDTQYVVLFPHRATTDRKVKAFVDFLSETLGGPRVGG